MSETYRNWNHPYEPAAKYRKKTAYFSMEFAVHQGLKIYSGGLGFLAGSHMRSAYTLKQNVIGIGMLWKYGYYDQGRNQDNSLQANFIEKKYSFLEDTGLEVEVKIYDNPSVKVRAYILRPEIFGTVPIYLLTTDVSGNDFLSRTITDHLYDNNQLTRISQSIVLGIGGAKIVEALGGADIYHLNEGHALPAFYYLRDRGVKKEQMVFTTHTPERAGNEEREAHHLNRCGFFGRMLTETELGREMVNGGVVSYTVAALRHARKANAVSQLHARVSREMWEEYEGICEIIPISNAQNQDFWQDVEIARAWKKNDAEAFQRRKRALKTELFTEVLDQTGKLFDPGVLTMVWARRFAQYKRADLLLQDIGRFEKLIASARHPIQIIWAGKPYPMDHSAIDLFNYLVQYTRDKPNLAVLIGYEMDLSRKLKTGSDVWLNTPRITREASGTSGMSAAMNGSVNVSVNDGWVPEFIRDGINGFVIPEVDYTLPAWDQDKLDSEHLYAILEQKVLPAYYADQDKWQQLVFEGISDVIPDFTSHRMARQYYEELYQ